MISHDAAAATRIQTEYLLTMHAPGDPPHSVDPTLTIFRTGAGGWAKGPRIVASIVQPAADWLRVMPSGSRRVDSRVTLQTDDGAIVYVTYGGVLVITDAHFARMAKGETLTADDVYFIVTPVFQTSHERYAWLNDVQAIGKLVELRVGEGGYVKYDFFVVR